MIATPPLHSRPLAFGQATPEQVAAKKAQQPTFGSAATIAATAQQAVETSLGGNKIGSFLKRMDFKDIATSNIQQIQVIYAACILWRWLFAYQRGQQATPKSTNEVREAMVRDTAGFSFWFFATPIIQRLFLAKVPPPELRSALIQEVPRPTPGPGAKNFFKQMNWRLNPLARYIIPKSRQVENQIEQAAEGLLRAGFKQESAEFQALMRRGQQLMKYRNLATGAALLTTIALLGIGINLLNFAMTRRNVASRQATGGGGH